jgi:hypothetical protein
MRFYILKSTPELAWICLTVLCAGCAIETNNPVVEVDPRRFLGYGPDPDPNLFEDPAPDQQSGDVDSSPPLVLREAAPNPISPQTRLSYAVPEGGARVVLAIYGIDGTRVRLLIDEVLEDGEYSAFWYGQNDRNRQVPSGVYIVSLRRGGEVKNRKVLFLR